MFMRRKSHRNTLGHAGLVAAILTMALFASACGSGDDVPTGDPEPSPPDGAALPEQELSGDDLGLSVEGEYEISPGQYAEVHLSPISSAAEVEEVEAAIEGILAGSDLIAFVDRVDSYLSGTFEDGLFDDHPEILPCFRYGAAPAFVIQLEQPDPVLLQSVADGLRTKPVVLSVESFGIDLGYSLIPAGLETDDEGREMGPDEYLAQTCSGYELIIELNSSVGRDERDALAAEILALEAVGAVLVDRDRQEGEGDYFVPDLSAYPAVAQCENGGSSAIRAILPAGDEAATTQVIAALESDARIVGFFGEYVESSYEAEFDEAQFALCERIGVYVNLVIDISDADAALVVSRALAVPGVADVDLELYEPEPAEDCDSAFEGGGDDFEALGTANIGASLGATALVRRPWLAAFSEVIDPCFVPTTSMLTIYRGDPDAATHRLLAEALCGLQGVISISSFDTEIAESDPFLDCLPLYLDVRMSETASDAERAAVSTVLEASDAVLSFDSYTEYVEDGYEPRIPQVVAGDIDPYLCDPELAWEAGNLISVRLGRVDEAAAAALAAQLETLASVDSVSGNAVLGQDEVAVECGHDLIWFWLSPDSTAAQRDAVYSALGARDDVLAVVVIDEGEDSHVHDGEDTYSSQWAGTVKFTTDEEPGDLDELVAQIAAMPGVVKAERIVHEDEFFECGEAEGFICEEEFTDLGDTIEP